MARAPWLLLFATASVAGGAYLLAPGSAYGLPGDPYQFGYNARYGMPALCIALVAVALATARRVQPFLFAGFAGATAVNLADTSYGPSVLSTRLFWLLTGGAIVVGGLVWWSRSGEPRRLARPGPMVLVGVAVVGAIAFGVIGHRLENRYLDNRYSMIPVASWARDIHDARIGVVGLPEQYPLFGPDLSNRVEYIGVRSAHGEFHSITDCTAFRTAIARRGYDYVVAGTTKWLLEPAPELDWLKADPHATDLHVIGTALTGSTDLGVFQIAQGEPAVPCP